MSLFESNIAFAHYMFRNPRHALKILDNAFQKVALNISKTHILKEDMVSFLYIYYKVFGMLYANGLFSLKHHI